MKFQQSIQLVVTRKSFQENEVSITHSGSAVYTPNSTGFLLEYLESTDGVSQVNLQIDQQTIQCVRYSQTKTICEWEMGKDTQIISITDMGRHIFEVTTNRVIIEKHQILVDYNLLLNEEEFDRIMISWNIEGDLDESN